MREMQEILNHHPQVPKFDLIPVCMRSNLKALFLMVAAGPNHQSQVLILYLMYNEIFLYFYMFPLYKPILADVHPKLGKQLIKNLWVRYFMPIFQDFSIVKNL
jgi:hypothetical protein